MFSQSLSEKSNNIKSVDILLRKDCNQIDCRNKFCFDVHLFGVIFYS